MTRKEVRAPLIGHLADLLAIAEPHRDHHLQHIDWLVVILQASARRELMEIWIFIQTSVDHPQIFH